MLTDSRSTVLRVKVPRLSARMLLKASAAAWAISWGALLVACVDGEPGFICRAAVIAIVLGAIVAHVYAQSAE